MKKIEKLKVLPKQEGHGEVSIFRIPMTIVVENDSFLHIGGSPSSLSEKKAPVFTVDGRPVIPASSFKGAFRHQVEQVLIEKKNELMEKLKFTNENLIKPCVPSTNPSKAEKELVGKYREQLRKNRNIVTTTENCWVEIDESQVYIPKNGVCPVCYFFGSPGLMGFLRIPNFWPEVGNYVISQTNIRIDRKTGTAATGAIVTGDQVKPGTVFKGDLEIVNNRLAFQFGRARIIGDETLDLWLKEAHTKPLEEVQLLLLNEILIPALNNITMLGGQRSKGGGKVSICLCV